MRTEDISVTPAVPAKSQLYQHSQTHTAMSDGWARESALIPLPSPFVFVRPTESLPGMWSNLAAPDWRAFECNQLEWQDGYLTTY